MNQPLMQNVPGSNEPLPGSWAERIFMRLHGRFGNPFFDKFRVGKMTASGDDVGIENAKQVWADELSGYSASEIKRGLDAQYTYPPSCDEFKISCRPQADTKCDWAEACEQMRIRLQGHGSDIWSRPQVYWAAVAIGWHDLNLTPWEQIKQRWANALEKARSDPIPEYLAQLPAPGQQSISREEAAKRVAELGVIVKRGVGPYKQWAVKIMDRVKRKESVPFAAEKLARECLAESGVAEYAREIA